MSFADIKDDMNLAEKMLKYLIAYVIKELPEEMEFLINLLTPELARD